MANSASPRGGGTTSRSAARAQVRLLADVQAFETVLDGIGIQAALRFLNQRTPHRFTAIYRFDDDHLITEHLYDREDPSAGLTAPVPIVDTYCSLVREAAGSVAISNAAMDERLTGHKERGHTLSYAGACIPGADGSPVGSLCHFDLRPHVFSDLDIPLLTAAAALLGTRLYQ